MATRIVYFLADEIPNDIELAELEYLNRKLQVTVMNASENVEFGEIDRILPCDYVAGTIPPEYAHIPVYDPESTPGGPIYITDVVGLPAALDAKVDEPVDIADVTGLQAELNTINAELDAAATLPIAIADVTGLQTALDGKQGKPVPISAVTGLQAELDAKAELPIAISDVTGLQAELDAVASLPIAISDVTGLQTSLDSKANLTDLTPIIAELATKADSPIQIQDVEGLETELDSVATLPIDISDVTGLQEALDSAGSLPIEISDVTGLQAELDEPVLISEVTGLQTALDSKADATDLDPIIAELATKQDAPVAISDVTGLQAELDSVATLPIEISDVNGLQAELDSVASLPIAISDVTGLQTASDAPVPIANVTGLQAELDAKADVTDLDPILLELATKADAPVLISDVTGLQTELDGKAELPIAISDVTGLQAELDSSATLPITIADVTGLQTELDGKAELPIAISDVTGLPTALDSKADVTDLDAILVELDTKLESPIAIADVTGLQANLDSLQTEIDAAATLPIAISDVTGLQAELDAPIAISDVTGLQAELDAPVGIADVTGLQAELDTKAELTDLDPIITDLNTKAELPIPISGVTNLQTTLDGKAPVTHAHGIADVTGLQAELDSKQVTPVPVSDVTGLQASLDSKAAVIHGHAIADVSGLQTALDGKSETTHVHPLATTSVDGFFSKTDKDKLDNIASNATAITFPAANAAGTLASGAPQPANAGAATSEGARSDHQHPLAGAANDGLMSAAHWTKCSNLADNPNTSYAAASHTHTLSLLPVVATTQHVYVYATGSNSNDGLTAGTAKLTIAGAWALLPATQTATFVLHLGAGSFFWTDPPDIAQIGYYAMIVVLGDAETIVNSGTVTASNTTTDLMTVTPATAMTLDQYVGHTIKITAGTIVGYKRLITFNDATTIRMSHDTPISTGAYDIVKQNSVINLSSVSIFSTLEIHFANVAITSTIARNIFEAFNNPPPRVMIGVDLRGSACLMLSGTIYCGFESVYPANARDICSYVATIAGAANYRSYSNWGISNSENFGATYPIYTKVETEGCVLLGCVALRKQLSLYLGRNIHCLLQFSRLTSIDIGSNNHCRLENVYFDSLSTLGNNTIQISGFAKVDIVNAYSIKQSSTGSRSIIYMLGFTELVMSGVPATWTSASSTGVAIYLSDNSKLSIYDDVNITGSGYLLHMLHLSEMKIQSSLSGTTAGTTSPVRILDCAKFIGGIAVVANAATVGMQIQGVGAMLDGSTCNVTCALTGAALEVSQGGTLRASNVTLINTATGVETDGMRVLSGGKIIQGGPPAFTLSGSSGFCINCKGGGQVCLRSPSAPSGWVGPTNTFCIGPAVGDQYPVTALNASFSNITLGVSSIYRGA